GLDSRCIDAKCCNTNWNKKCNTNYNKRQQQWSLRKMRVEHVSGNMFEHIPSADAIFIKWVLHDWDDDDCIKVLRRCYEATPANGKVIIVDALVVEAKKDENNKDLQRGVGLEFDMGMMLYCSGGKERTEMEFKQIFIKAGFKSYTIFKLPSIQTIFEVSKF
ncbi:hypothetical protein SUGI_0633290, partial [Cryptomeria japonica]